MLLARLERGDSPEHQACVVDEALEATEPSCHVGDDAFARIWIGDIAFCRQRLAASGLDLVRERLRLLRARALLGEVRATATPMPVDAQVISTALPARSGITRRLSAIGGPFAARVRCETWPAADPSNRA
jgi:hypothetical protein